jgi:predicted RNase H-like HicB family nuclease
MKYVVIIEEALNGGYSAYVPDLPLCFTVGETLEEVTANIKDAIESYIEEVQLDGLNVPAPSVQAALVEV